VAAAGMEEEVLLEVRCAGCGDTLEVERGLTEFGPVWEGFTNGFTSGSR